MAANDIEKETKRIISSILVSSPVSCTVLKLRRDFEDMVGYDIPFIEMGYKNLFHYLNSISDVIKVNGSNLNSEIVPVITNKTAHLNELIMNQKLPNLSRNNNRARFRPPPKRRAEMRITSQPNPSYSLRSNYHPPYTNQNLSPFPRRCPPPPRPLYIPSNKSFVVSKHDQSPIVNWDNTNVADKESEARVIKPNTPINLSLSQTTETLNQRKPNRHSGTSEMSVDSLDERASGGSASARRRVRLAHEQIDSGRSPLEGTTITFAGGNGERAASLGNIEVSKTGSNIPQIIQSNLRKLIQDCPDGIWCTELPAEYKKRYKQPLVFQDFGHKCLISMCGDLQDIFHCERESLDDYKLYDKSRPLPNVAPMDDSVNRSKSFDVSEISDSALPTLDWKDFKHLVPEDAFDFDGTIERVFFPEGFRRTTNVEIRVAEIYDPSKFWIWIDDKRLDQMMDDMQLFYRANADRYLIPEFLLHVGLYCVIDIMNEYHRGIIRTLLPCGGIVKVFSVDYGTVINVPSTAVWFLANQFAIMPRQAIRARLADIWPPYENKAWTRESIERFTNLCSMKPVLMQIVRIDPEPQIVEAYLYYHSCTMKSINKILVDDGHALFTAQTRQKSITFPNCVPKVKYIHLFPTFREIEYGTVPSASDMNAFVNYEVPLDFCYPQYFKKPDDSDILDRMKRETEQMIKNAENIKTHISKKELYGKKKSVKLQKAIFGDLYEEVKDQLSDRIVFFENIDFKTHCAKSERSRNRKHEKTASAQPAGPIVNLEEVHEYSDFVNLLKNFDPNQNTKTPIATRINKLPDIVQSKSLNPFLNRSYSLTNPFIDNTEDDIFSDTKSKPSETNFGQVESLLAKTSSLDLKQVNIRKNSEEKTFAPIGEVHDLATNFPDLENDKIDKLEFVRNYIEDNYDSENIHKPLLWDSPDADSSSDDDFTSRPFFSVRDKFRHKPKIEINLRSASTSSIATKTFPSSDSDNPSLEKNDLSMSQSVDYSVLTDKESHVMSNDEVGCQTTSPDELTGDSGVTKNFNSQYDLKIDDLSGSGMDKQIDGSNRSGSTSGTMIEMVSECTQTSEEDLIDFGQRHSNIGNAVDLKTPVAATSTTACTTRSTETEPYADDKAIVSASKVPAPPPGFGAVPQYAPRNSNPVSGPVYDNQAPSFYPRWSDNDMNVNPNTSYYSPHMGYNQFATPYNMYPQNFGGYPNYVDNSQTAFQQAAIAYQQTAYQRPAYPQPQHETQTYQNPIPYSSCYPVLVLNYNPPGNNRSQNQRDFFSTYNDFLNRAGNNGNSN